MADSSVRIFFDAQELEPVVLANLYKHRNNAGIMAFIPDIAELTDEDKEMLDGIGKRLQGDGSPSQRLRNKIFKYWKWTNEYRKNHGGEPLQGDFEDFYVYKMEQMMETIEKRMQ